jgi:hypothetical protein
MLLGKKQAAHLRGAEKVCAVVHHARKVVERVRQSGGQPRVRAAKQGHAIICRWEAAGEAAQGEQSGSQEDATPTAAEKGESRDEGDKSDLWNVTDQGGRVLPTKGAMGPKGVIQVDCSWEHRRRSSAPRLLIWPSLNKGVLGSSDLVFYQERASQLWPARHIIMVSLPLL